LLPAVFLFVPAGQAKNAEAGYPGLNIRFGRSDMDYGFALADIIAVFLFAGSFC
jgi:hypothetical protein